MVGRVLDRVVVDAALGLYHLHAHSVVHRDIASRNILIDRNYRAKVSDFGVCLFSFFECFICIIRFLFFVVKMARAQVDDEQGAYTDSSVGPLKWFVYLRSLSFCFLNRKKHIGWLPNNWKEENIRLNPMFGLLVV
jgi:serine/threonine protein kinase